MKKILILCLVLFFFSELSLCANTSSTKSAKQKIVTSTKRIHLPKYPGAYNPSIMRLGDNYVMTFRFIPSRSYYHWISYIGIVLLDESFEPISEEQLLDTRLNDKRTPNQSEDARIFECDGKLYLIYNDNMELECPAMWERRDMYMAELFFDDGRFFLGDPVKLVFPPKYRDGPWQKNWSPFVWNGMILFSYLINPHLVIKPDLISGICTTCFETKKSVPWSCGSHRGGTPAQLVDGEYLAFFHSGIWKSSPCSDGKELWHYYMGAYTFSAEPPFEMTKMSSTPIEAPGFYTYSSHEKRVIYPSGFVVEGNNLYLSYGKDDYELWIATIDLNELKKSLVPAK